MLVDGAPRTEGPLHLLCACGTGGAQLPEFPARGARTPTAPGGNKFGDSVLARHQIGEQLGGGDWGGNPSSRALKKGVGGGRAAAGWRCARPRTLQVAGPNIKVASVSTFTR